MIGYVQGIKVYQHIAPDDEEDYNKYYITVNGYAYDETFTSKKLTIPHDEYIKI